MSFIYFAFLGGLVLAGAVAALILRILRAQGALADWPPADQS